MLGPEEIRSYQVYLTNDKKLSPNSIHIIVAALRFLFKVTLKKDWTFEDVLPLPKKQQKLPIVLSPEEVQRFLACVQSTKHRAILTACYAAVGIRGVQHFLKSVHIVLLHEVPPWPKFVACEKSKAQVAGEIG